MIRKVINKFNGNLCFSAASETDSYIFECDKITKNLYYAATSNIITDIQLQDRNSYLVAFGTNILGEFIEGSLNETFLTLPVRVDELQKPNNYDFYILDRDQNFLIKYRYSEGFSSSSSESIANTSSSSSSSIDPTSSSDSSEDYGIIWTYILPDALDKSNSHILFRECDSSIVYYNKTNIHLIKDNSDSAILVNSLAISGTKDLKVVLGSETIPNHFYVRSRQV